MKKLLITLFLVLLLPLSVMAEDGNYKTGELDNLQEQETEIVNETIVNSTTDDDEFISYTNSVIDPQNVDDVLNAATDVDHVEQKILTKLYQIAELLKKISVPIAIIMFVIGAIAMVTGALGRKNGTQQGLIICILSVIMYAVCMYSQEIVIAVGNWLAS